MADLVDRLKGDADVISAAGTGGSEGQLVAFGMIAKDLREAAAEISRLRSQLAVMREALIDARPEIKRQCGKSDFESGPSFDSILGKIDAALAEPSPIADAMCAVVEAARVLCAESRWVAGLSEDYPNKGSGNRLVDALASLDHAKAGNKS